MTKYIAPTSAAKLAATVYDLEKGVFSKDAVQQFSREWKFDLNASHSRIMGRSGTGFVIHKQTGFCSVAHGVGDYVGHILVLARGTSTTNAFDWCTDGTVGYTRSLSGFLVHTGFYETFKTILAQGLKEFFESLKQPVVRVHCIGHSLGGALATLIAEWVCSQKKASDVALYTFGSPRVGFNDYSLHVESILTTKNIFRVYHQRDPVPWVPVWPFVHVPPISYYRLGGSGSDFISFAAHSMDKSYVKIIDAQYHNAPWQHIQDRTWIPPTEKAVQNWLNSDGVVSFCAKTLALLGAAIAWVFDVACKAVGIAVQLVLSGAITTLDLLVQILMDAMLSSVELASDSVKKLIRKITQFNGKPMLQDSEITKATTIVAFKDMQEKLNREVQNALRQATG